MEQKLQYIVDKIGELNIQINEKQAEQFFRYYELLVEWNGFMNLTGITDFEEVVCKHFVDSLSIISTKDMSTVDNLIDIGTGAGFPGIPLKIVRPDLKITLVDSLNKRINFLNEVITRLNLKEISTVHSRIEDFGKNKEYREKFDFVTARAVAHLSVLSEYLLPISKVGGKCICMKGSNVEEELDTGKNAIKILGGKINCIDQFELPESDISRNIIVLDKIKNTSAKFPRKAGIPSKEPLK